MRESTRRNQDRLREPRHKTPGSSSGAGSTSASGSTGEAALPSASGAGETTGFSKTSPSKLAKLPLYAVCGDLPTQQNAGFYTPAFFPPGEKKDSEIAQMLGEAYNDRNELHDMNLAGLLTLFDFFGPSMEQNIHHWAPPATLEIADGKIKPISSTISYGSEFSGTINLVPILYGPAISNTSKFPPQHTM